MALLSGVVRDLNDLTFAYYCGAVIARLGPVKA